MEDNKKDSYLFTALGFSGWICALVLILFMHFCQKNDQPIIHKTEITNIYDSAPRIIPVKIPAPFTYTLEVPMFQKIDTAAIVSRYFEKNVYRQVIEDSCLRASISDTIWQNRLAGRGFKYQLLKPLRTVESTTVWAIPKEKLRFYIGAFAQINNNFLQGYGPEAYLATRRDLVFKLNYDIKNNSFGLGAGIRLFSKHARDTVKLKP